MITNRIERAVHRFRSLPGLRQLDKLRYERVFAKQKGWNLFSGVYPTFEAALKDIPDTKPAGYDNTSAAQMYTDQIQKIRLVDYPVIYWLGTLLPDLSRLFDYGGHVGLRFYSYSSYLNFPPGFTWTVWDVPTVTREGRKIAAEQNANGLHFTDDLKDSAVADIFFASGSLQYFEESLPDTMGRLGIRPAHILINGFPLHEKHEFVTINNMSTAFCTYKIFCKQKFLERMAADGYRLHDIWQNSSDKRCSIPFHEDYNGAVYYGMYFSDSRRLNLND